MENAEVNEGIEKVVEGICHSLRNKPYEWEETSQGITHLPSRTLFRNNDVIYFFGVWDGECTQKIFNDEQVQKIRDAFQDFRKYRRSVGQDSRLSIKRVLISFFG